MFIAFATDLWLLYTYIYVYIYATVEPEEEELCLGAPLIFSTRRSRLLQCIEFNEFASLVNR